MSQNISKSVIKALTKLINETPYFVTMVEVNSDQRFMILGQRSVFFVDNSLRNSSQTNSIGEKPLKYEQIEKIQYFRSHPNIIKIMLRSH